MGSRYFDKLISADKSSLAQYLNYKKKQNGNWIDMEKELGIYANILRSEPSIQHELPPKLLEGKNIANISNFFRREFFQLCSALKEYLIDIEKMQRIIVQI